MSHYAEMPGLSALYLEDSYLLDIVEAAGRLTFWMSAVLAPEHPAYHDPLPGEQYCYAHGALVFSDVAHTDWLERSTRRYVDATGETDLGNIDSLTSADGTYEVTGDWGRVRVRCAGPPRFTLRDAP
ncbi:hypothetical protein [Mycolicibacterium arseniciresistens]|uniref:Glyoxalase n=1 Tax=Mycolicibacterium arseniciresistens TaxID=3062257 RepID=A0ABT8UL87_9MYCO|nr:hypothetical protein [Mycolicibacterium arseniciresistens]MDO3638559.1 hypothetical protein [Mycolicibacterium arseniciresistens]